MSAKWGRTSDGQNVKHSDSGRLPTHDEASLYLRGRRDSPPFVWLEFGTDVRR